jgi:ORF6N domain
MIPQNLSQSIGAKIYHYQNQQIILSSDLSALYEVQTKVINQAVKRNIERFPPLFAFRITNKELQKLRSQFVTLDNSQLPKQGSHSKFDNLVFTELGVVMLATVLKNQLAHEMTIEIVKTFVSLRKIISNNDDTTHRISTLEKVTLKHQNQINDIQTTLKGFSLPSSGIFFNNQIFDAYAFSSDLIKKAKKSIILIDNYIDETTLLQLSKRKTNVICVIYTERITPAIELDLEKHNSQYSPIEIRILKNTHDRFLLIDNKELYHLGASLKDLGKRWFAFSRMDGFLNEVTARLT